MDLLLTIIICISISFFFATLAKRLNFSYMIGLILAGIMIGSSSLREIILEPNMHFVSNFGDIGFIFLMFFAGLEISWSGLYKERKDAAIVSIFATVLPVLLGTVVFLALGFSLLTSITIGICVGITADATKAMLLIELKELKTKLGS